MPNVITGHFRPTTFDEIVGQEHITRTLKNSIGQERIHHAYLFTGTRGTGKTTAARVLAKALNCENGPISTPCDTCDSCVDIARSGSIDVREIDAASSTGVEDIREIIVDSVAISPTRDRYRIFIIDEVHQLSAKAFDALLKTIEEPPAHAIFILATTEAHKVPDTIQSRCQIFEFRTLPLRVIAKRLRTIVDEMNNPWLPQDMLLEQIVTDVRNGQNATDSVDVKELDRRYDLLKDFIMSV